jgi:hypothetical protein
MVGGGARSSPTVIAIALAAVFDAEEVVWDAETRTALDGHGIVGVGGGTEGALAVDIVGEAAQKSEGVISPQWLAGQCSNGRDETKE